MPQLLQFLRNVPFKLWWVCLFPSEDLSASMCITHLKSQYAPSCFSSQTQQFQVVLRRQLVKMPGSPFLSAMVSLIMKWKGVKT